MKILALSNLYPPDFLGGYEIGCAQVVDALIARGHDVRVLTGSPRKPVPSPPHVLRTLKLADVYDDFARGANTPIVNEQLDAEARYINAHNVHALLEQLERFAPDAVYVNNLMGLGGLGLIGALDYLRVPWVWHLGDCVPLLLTWLWAKQGFEPALMKAFGRLDGQYIVVSRRLLDEIETAGVKLRGSVEILPYWITGQRPPARESVHRPGRPLRIISVGQVNKQKGVEVLIEAAGLLLGRGLGDFEVDVFGRIADPSFGEMIRRHGLEDRVRLLGPRPNAELLRLYGEYDVVAFPTWEREPFGLVPIEAAARGCVPVISRSCGVGEFLVHGVHCLKAERSPESFADVLGAVIEGRVDLGPLSRRGADVVWRDFHIDGYAARLEAMLARGAARPRDGAGTHEEAYRLALLAEKMTRLLVFERHCA